MTKILASQRISVKNWKWLHPAMPQHLFFFKNSGYASRSSTPVNCRQRDRVRKMQTTRQGTKKRMHVSPVMIGTPVITDSPTNSFLCVTAKRKERRKAEEMTWKIFPVISRRRPLEYEVSRYDLGLVWLYRLQPFNCAFVTIGTPVITDRTWHLNIESAWDVQVSGPVSCDRCSYRNITN